MDLRARDLGLNLRAFQTENGRCHIYSVDNLNACHEDTAGQWCPEPKACHQREWPIVLTELNTAIPTNTNQTWFILTFKHRLCAAMTRGCLAISEDDKGDQQITVGVKGSHSMCFHVPLCMRKSVTCLLWSNRHAPCTLLSAVVQVSGGILNRRKSYLNNRLFLQCSCNSQSWKTTMNKDRKSVV